MVQGSAREPYVVTFEGAGSALQAFCSCPAGRQAAQFCKHAAALLMGDVGRLVGDSADMEQLARRSEGSPLLERARQHVPSKPKRAPACGFASVEEVAAAYDARLAASKLVGILEREDDGAVRFTVGRPFKNGTLRKAGQVMLSYEPVTYDLELDADGDWRSVAKPSTRLWRAGVAGDAKRAFMSLDSAFAFFEEHLEKLSG